MFRQDSGGKATNCRRFVVPEPIPSLLSKGRGNG